MVFHWFCKVLEWGAPPKRRTNKNNSFGDGLREPKPSFSFVFSRFPCLGGVWAPGVAQGSQGSLGAAEEPGSWEPGKGSGRLGGAVEAEGSLEAAGIGI